MIRVEVPKNSYKVDATTIDGGIHLEWVLNQDVQDWFNQKLGYVPEFNWMYIDLPTEGIAIEFKLRWY